MASPQVFLPDPDPGQLAGWGRGECERMEREEKQEVVGSEAPADEPVRLGDFVRYEMPAGFYLDLEKVKEVRERLEKLGLDTDVEGGCLWIYNGSESINIFADFVLMIYSVPEYGRSDAVVQQPDDENGYDLPDEEVERILNLIVVDEKGSINWDIFKQI